MMRFGQFIIEPDRTGFIMIKKKEWDFFISLTPITKIQFERFNFLYEGNPIYTDKFYREKLKKNPRCSIRRCKGKEWQLFLTGFNLNEIQQFISYFGKNFRLPKVEEWKKLYVSKDELENYDLKRVINSIEGICKAQKYLVENKLYPFLREGILELVNDNGNIRCIGKPYNDFLPNLWNACDVREPNWDSIWYLIGFRLVKEE